MLMLTTPYRIQQRTPHNCLHQSTLLYQTLCRCLCLPPHTKYNNEHPTIACTNQCFSIEHFANAYADHHISNTMMNTSQLLALVDAATSNTLPMPTLPPSTKYNTEHIKFACTNRHCYIEHFANAYAYHHIPNSTMNTPQSLAPIDTAISNTSPMLMLTST